MCTQIKIVVDKITSAIAFDSRYGHRLTKDEKEDLAALWQGLSLVNKDYFRAYARNLNKQIPSYFKDKK